MKRSSLAYKGCIAAAGAFGCTTPRRYSVGAGHVAVSPDGESVYVVSRVADSITSFDCVPFWTRRPPPMTSN